jgi:hypothetical protein
MPGRQRVVLPEVVHHVTQRGVDRSTVFVTDADRQTYLGLVDENLQPAGAYPFFPDLPRRKLRRSTDQDDPFFPSYDRHNIDGTRRLPVLTGRQDRAVSLAFPGT